MPRKNLIICAAGDISLHKQWYVPERSYDILVIYYGDNSEPLKGTCDYLITQKGYKIELARKCLLSHFYQMPDFYRGYEYIWFPDCDIELAPAEVDRMFVLAKERNAALFQPSIANKLNPERFDPAVNWGGWKYTHINVNTRYRRITHPEIMMPGFSIWAWENVFLRSLYLFPDYRIGWGIENVWGILSCSYTPFKQPQHFIFDDIHAYHTKPIGTGAEEMYKLAQNELSIYHNSHLRAIETCVTEEFS